MDIREVAERSGRYRLRWPEIQTLGEGQSQAGSIEETLSTGEKKSMLRAYGSVSYAGFKSYLYAGLKKDDPRVQAVLDFCRRHYTVTHMAERVLQIYQEVVNVGAGR